MMETVTVEMYKDQYGERVGLRYRYNPDTNQVLKERLGFPKFKWDSEKKLWSVQAYPQVVAEACEILDELSYDTSIIRTYVQDLPAAPRQDCWTKVKRTRLYLHWPFIPDAELRDSVRLAVRSISGRKFHAEEKCWSIPVAQARTLYGLLSDIYPSLADAIVENEQVSEEVEKSIERVEISGAAELSDKRMEEVDQLLKGKFPEGLDLYPFQKVAVAFANMSQGRCLIGDEMGIGKTISTIGYAAIHPTDRPAVVVCPANVKFNWKKELNRWLPNEEVQVVESGKQEIEMTDFVIINYDLMHKKQDELRAIAPRLMVLDESHYIKNSGSKNKPVQRTVATINVARSTPKVIALSGTAISSRPKEFFNTLNLMRPNQFSSFWDFAQRYCDPYHDGFGWNFDGASNILELNERTRDLCIRRLKSEVLPELPPKTRTFIPVHLTRKERSPYDSAQDSWYQRIDSFYMDGAPLPKGIMLNMITDLRHICGQIKVNHAVDWVSEYHDQTGKPIVVFTHHRDVLARMAEKIEAKGMKVNTISGDTNSKSRQEIVDDFQANNIDVLICNTIAAKEGITLTAADTVLFIEREWVPTDEEQAEDRVYRIGQESQHVHAVYLSVAGTIDEHFDRVVAEKRAVVKAVLDGGNVEQRKGLVAELVKRLKQERGWEIK
jgi:SWI/SNF-related matrix-associated actin-dependent regulator 1 of chromatin subfamily A|tara:strand:- start:1378 stop:3372 length:1995 start_codon:yes stop_codon:yes gene_type:complete